MRRWKVLLPLWLMFIPALVWAATKAGVTLPETALVAGQQLVLNGLGVREATIFRVNVYVAGLYLPTKSADANAILSSQDTKRIQLVFLRNVDGDTIAEAIHEGFEKNSPRSVVAMQPRLGKLRALLPDLKKGNTVTFTFVLSTGVEVNVNGTVRGTIEGSDFASALFACWLGPKPPNESLKAGLLGRE